jgi:hypothetical protein
MGFIDANTLTATLRISSGSSTTHTGRLAENVLAFPDIPPPTPQQPFVVRTPSSFPKKVGQANLRRADPKQLSTFNNVHNLITWLIRYGKHTKR